MSSRFRCSCSASSISFRWVISSEKIRMPSGRPSRSPRAGPGVRESAPADLQSARTPRRPVGRARAGLPVQGGVPSGQLPRRECPRPGTQGLDRRRNRVRSTRPSMAFRRTTRARRSLVRQPFFFSCASSRATFDLRSAAASAAFSAATSLAFSFATSARSFSTSSPLAFEAGAAGAGAGG